MIPLSADPIESLTPERLSSWLSASIGEVSIASMTTKAVGTGQMASSYRLDLTYADRRPADAPDSVILKVSSQDESSRQMAAAASAYLREVRFYQKLAPVAGARVPRCYHADISSSAMDFVLVMEDMGPARSIDQLGGCSVDQAALAVAQGLASDIASTSSVEADLTGIASQKNIWEGAGAHWLREDQVRDLADETALAALLAIALRGKTTRRGRASAMTAGVAARQAKRKELSRR